MKKMTSTLILFTFLLFSFSTILAQNTFIGTKKCGMCHKKDTAGKQLKIWQDSKHANAFKTLQTAEADKIAKGKAVEDPKCLKCHATGYDLDAKMMGKDFKIDHGVQCESCHGAGSGYKSKKTMKDHAKSVAKGMVEYKDKAAIQKQCESCHNKTSPTFKKFDFEKQWAEIAHPVPKK